MKIRHGIDIVSVQRIQESVTRQGSRFLNRVFTAAECRYCESNRRKFEHYGARFAAKEAFMKAVKGKKNERFCFRRIEIRRQRTGKPYIHLTAAARRHFGLSPECQIELSLAHEREYAVATVVIYETNSHC